MPEITYNEPNFKIETFNVIMQARDILMEYAEMGYGKMTMRQLYYQFVGRGIFPDSRRWRRDPNQGNKWVPDPNGTRNADPNYTWLLGIVNKGRMAGYISWSLIEDRTRKLQKKTAWKNPKQIMDAVISSYHLHRWKDQVYRPEVWIEKDALSGVIDPVCKKLDVPYFACKGYASLSALWKAGQRLIEYMEDDRKPYIFYMGDHDPSGIDMTNDIENRLETFLEHEGFYHGNDWMLVRIALNMDQINLYDPPSDPAKLTDSRGKAYVKRYGPKAWELDALSPEVMTDLIKEAVDDITDDDKLAEVEEREETEIEAITEAFEGLGFEDDDEDDD